MSDTSYTEILLCSTPRSGSTFLAEAMYNTGCMGYPDEFFNNNQNHKGDSSQTLFEKYYAELGAASYEDYLGKLVARYKSSNNVHSVKMHFQHFQKSLHLGYFQNPAQRFYVFIYRKDIAAQAASLAIAMRTQQWNSRMKSQELDNIEIPDEFLARAYRELVFDNLRWKAFFDMFNTPYISLEYEEITNEVGAAVSKIAEYASIALNEGALDNLEQRITGKKQSASLNSELKNKLTGMTLENYAPGNIMFDAKVL